MFLSLSSILWESVLCPSWWFDLVLTLDIVLWIVAIESLTVQFIPVDAYQYFVLAALGISTTHIHRHDILKLDTTIQTVSEHQVSNVLSNKNQQTCGIAFFSWGRTHLSRLYYLNCNDVLKWPINMIRCKEPQGTNVVPSHPQLFCFIQKVDVPTNGNKIKNDNNT